jgi:hypothetical protein
VEEFAQTRRFRVINPEFWYSILLQHSFGFASEWRRLVAPLHPFWESYAPSADVLLLLPTLAQAHLPPQVLQSTMEALRSEREEAQAVGAGTPPTTVVEYRRQLQAAVERGVPLTASEITRLQRDFVSLAAFANGVLLPLTVAYSAVEALDAGLGPRAKGPSLLAAEAPEKLFAELHTEAPAVARGVLVSTQLELLTVTAVQALALERAALVQDFLRTLPAGLNAGSVLTETAWNRLTGVLEGTGVFPEGVPHPRGMALDPLEVRQVLEVLRALQSHPYPAVADLHYLPSHRGPGQLPAAAPASSNPQDVSTALVEALHQLSDAFAPAGNTEGASGVAEEKTPSRGPSGR